MIYCCCVGARKQDRRPVGEASRDMEKYWISEQISISTVLPRPLFLCLAAVTTSMRFHPHPSQCRPFFPRVIYLPPLSPCCLLTATDCARRRQYWFTDIMATKSESDSESKTDTHSLLLSNWTRRCRSDLCYTHKSEKKHTHTHRLTTNRICLLSLAVINFFSSRQNRRSPLVLCPSAPTDHLGAGATFSSAAAPAAQRPIATHTQQ